YEKAIRDRYGDLADAFLQRYPSANIRESMLATTRDALYGWTSERLVRKQTELGLPSYLYFFDHGYPAEEAANLHGFHASELPDVSGPPDRVGPNWPKTPATPEQARFSDAMLGYWTGFVKTGHPEAAGEPTWSPYGATAAYMHFAETPEPSERLMPGMYSLV